MEWITETVDLVKIHWLRFAALLILSSFLLGISSDILLVPSFKINQFLDPNRIVLMSVIAFLMAINFTVLLSKVSVNQSDRRIPTASRCGMHSFGHYFTNCSCRKQRGINQQFMNKSTPLVGVLPAFFASSCIVCQPFWLIAIGLGTTTAFLADLSIPLMLLSIILLIFSIYQSSKKICEVKLHGKNI